MIILFIIVYLLVGLIFAVYTEEKADSKGYVNTKAWFWFGFFGTIIAYITICLQDDDKPNKRFSFFVILISIIIFIMNFYYSSWPFKTIKRFNCLGAYNEEKITFLNDVKASMPYDQNWYVYNKFQPIHFENGYMYTENNKPLVTRYDRDTDTYVPRKLTYFDYNDYIIGFNSGISYEPQNRDTYLGIDKNSLDWYIFSLWHENNYYRNYNSKFYIIKPISPNDNQTYQVAEVTLYTEDMFDKIHGNHDNPPAFSNPKDAIPYGRKIIDYIIENRIGEWYPE